MLGLKEKDFVELTKSEFLSHFNPILERASKTAHITDEDVEEINKLKIKYSADLALEAVGWFFTCKLEPTNKKHYPHVKI